MISKFNIRPTITYTSCLFIPFIRTFETFSILLRTMLANYSVQCMRLNLCDSEFSRQISGLDTRGIALNGFYNIYGGTNGRPVSLFCEVTSTLRIGSGLALEVIQ